MLEVWVRVRGMYAVEVGVVDADVALLIVRVLADVALLVIRATVEDGTAVRHGVAEGVRVEAGDGTREDHH